VDISPPLIFKAVPARMRGAGCGTDPQHSSAASIAAPNRPALASRRVPSKFPLLPPDSETTRFPGNVNCHVEKDVTLLQPTQKTTWDYQSTSYWFQISTFSILISLLVQKLTESRFVIQK
jgi:hypothetical protein